jgi:hypothetical protein
MDAAGQRQGRGKPRGGAAVLAAALLAVAIALPTRPLAALGLGGFDLRYSMEVGGVPVATVALSVAPGERDTTSRLVVSTDGLAALFGRHVTTMRATTGPDEQPLNFTARYEKPDRTRDLAVQWNEAGHVARAVEIRRGRERPSEVPPALLRDAVDPLTGVLQLRRWLAEPSTAHGSELRIPLFDGRKRLDLEARRLDDRGAGDAARPTIEVRLLPVYGFDANDAFVSWPGETQRWFEVTLSNDGRFAPIAVTEAGRPLLTATHECSEATCAPLREP